MPDQDFGFHLIYDGPALENGTIEPALVALADLVDQSERILEPALPPVTVRVRSRFRPGSFDIGLELADAYQRFVSLFSSNEMPAWATLLSLLGISGFGLFQLLKKAKGTQPQLEVEHSETVRIRFAGESPQEIDKRIWRLFNHLGIRKSVHKVVEPLTKEGIDKLEIRRGGRKTLEIQKNEVDAFKPPTEAESLEVSENPNLRLVIISPAFREGYKWRVFDGTRTLWVTVRDPAFLARINEGKEAFRKGDLLHVRLQTSQWIEDGELKAEHVIIEVLKHEKRIGQWSLGEEFEE
jgi:hypothetical protein